MTTRETKSWDDLTETSSHDDGSSNDSLTLDSGDYVVGQMVVRQRDMGEYGDDRLTISVDDCTVDDVEAGNLVTHWTNGQIQRQLEQSGVSEGDVIGIRNTGETETFDDDGETVEYEVYKLRVDFGGSD